MPNSRMNNLNQASGGSAGGPLQVPFEESHGMGNENARIASEVLASKYEATSEKMTQDVPPSPNSAHSLGSIESSSRQRSHEGLTLDYEESDPELDELCEEEEEDEEELDAEEFLSQHIADVATRVSMCLTDIVNRNDKVPFTSDKLTRFHSRTPPGISIKDYILRIIKFCNLDKAVLLVLLFFVDLFTNSYPNFRLNSLTVHRFLITACTVAAKGLCDQFCSNTHYAKVGGLKVMELNLLEVEFLTRTRYMIVPNRFLLPKYYAQIQAKAQVQAAESKTSPVPGSRTSKGSTTSPVPGAAFFINRKHAREELNPSSSSDPDTVETSRQPRNINNATAAVGNSAAGGAASGTRTGGNKGLRAMKETFRFLQPSKKKRSDHTSS